MLLRLKPQINAGDYGNLDDNVGAGEFERTVLGHLDAAHNLARWLTREAHDAEDVVQEACLRAFAAFGDFHGGDARCWLLRIVRNTCYTFLDRHRRRERSMGVIDEMPVD